MADSMANLELEELIIILQNCPVPTTSGAYLMNLVRFLEVCPGYQ